MGRRIISVGASNPLVVGGTGKSGESDRSESELEDHVEQLAITVHVKAGEDSRSEGQRQRWPSFYLLRLTSRRCIFVEVLGQDSELGRAECRNDFHSQ